MRILAVSGSLRAASLNTRLLRHASEQAPPGLAIELWDGLRAIPPYDADDDEGPGPDAVSALRQAIAEADGLLFATPEYNSSIPGALKNAIDWASRPRAETPLQGKPVAVLGVTTGRFGAVWAQAELRKALGSAGARVVDLELPVGGGDAAFDEAGALADERLRERLDEIIEALAAEVGRDREPAAA